MKISIEEVERLAALEKEDWQRKVNQGVLKSDLNQSLAALGGMEAVEKFRFSLVQEMHREEARERDAKSFHRHLYRVSPLKKGGAA